MTRSTRSRQLADDGVIDPQRIGATGGSYGGGMSIALGALKTRTQLPDGSLVPWTSPLGKPLRIAATVPEFTWSDIAYSLTPNGSMLDYVAAAPYLGGGHRVGVQKQSWNSSLYLAGAALGYYAPLGSDPVGGHHGLEGAHRHRRAVRRAIPPPRRWSTELTANHSAFYLDDSIPPAPALLANGWNDDLFPVDESLRYYNKVRAKHPDTPISMFHLDFGHSPRAGAISAADRAALTAAENAWLDHYVKGVGPEPADARGGVDILTSKCPTSARRHPLPRAVLGAARAGRDPARRGRGADDRARPARRRRTPSRPATSAPRPRARTTPRRPPTASRRRRAPTRSRARRRSSPSSPSPAPTTWSPRGSTTSTARRSG